MHVRIRGEAYGRFRCTYDRDDYTFRLTWWQFGPHLFLQRVRVVGWPTVVLPGVG